MPAPAPVGVPTAQLDNQSSAKIPFRKATVERSSLEASITGTLTAASQQFNSVINGSGYIYGMLLQMVATAAGNSALVAAVEDAPWSSLAQVVLSDVNGELVNIDGFSLFLANLAIGGYRSNFWSASTNPALTQFLAGNGATAGSLACTLRVPVGNNRRDLLGILGNQDRAQQYTLSGQVAASGSIYSTAPTTLPGFTLTPVYESYAVPLPQGAAGPQEVVPPGYGTLNFLTKILSDSVPQGGTTQNHFLKRLGNTIRYIILVFRANGSRATAAAAMPSRITFLVGDETIFSEPASYRQALMFERYGFDWPNGVLVYDNLHDFSHGSGYELGDDYYHTNKVQNAQFQITYPSGFGSTNNSLTIITADSQMH